MFKPTPSLQKMLRRLPLSPKQAGKEYYKGNRVGSMGTIDRYGNFSPDWSKVRTYVYPLQGTRNCEVRSLFCFSRRGNFTGEDYLRAWKLAGGHDIVDAGAAGAAEPYRNMPTPFEEQPASKS
ncbi:hypothetical protein EK21DRAFT_75624 [Setomelanomma holmii]|uniref:Uncharacterized protein n=1 Tax=Setomelanomma holmii TaxID=210430 RepID=A0A9P4LHR5_9PLEO|nr:hypothetical protein EK21DRAFT_75624 [Setomelanomma holmii]